MSGKVSVKMILGIFIMLLLIVLGVLGASTAKNYLASASGGNEPTAVSAIATENAVKISWNTEKETFSRVQYGTTPASMLLQSDLTEESEPKATHSINIKNLKGGQSYYYRIKTGDDLYDNGGIPWSFKTKGAGESKPLVLPTQAAAVLPSQAAVQTESSAPSSGANSPSACQFGVDYNKDGSTNGVDMAYCSQNNLTAPTPTVVSSAAATCQFGVDYNKDGSTNGVDMAYCSQNNK